ncbi:MAG TPA: AsmA family protein [Bryobacteraceae bacterium]|nr:AsmA family protein [Bryobacteraceae bacterium]
MKRLLIVVVCLFVLVLIAGVVVASLVSGNSSRVLASSLSDALGVPVSLGDTKFDWKQWLLLKPAVEVDNIAIGNPPGFHAAHLLEAQKLSAQVALLPLLHKDIQVRSINIDHPLINVETNAHGTSNVEALLKKENTKSTPAPASSGSSSAGNLVVDQFSVTSGEVTFLDSARTEGKIDIRGIDLSVRDFSRDQPCRVEFSARLFGGESRVRLTGQAGPFGADTLPLNGTLSVAITPAEIPLTLRRAQFGNLLVAPGKTAKVTLDTTIRGDVYHKLSGPAKLSITGMLIGRDEQHVIPLSGEFPLAFAVSRPISAPSYHLGIANAQLHLGKGEWLGAADLNLHGTATSGRSSGKIRNVDINELLSAATPSSGKIYGVLEIPSYSFEFAGANADQVRSSMHGEGKLSVTQGRLAALDLLAHIKHAMENPQELFTGQKGDTPFTTLLADMKVAESKLNLNGIQLDGPALRVNGQGSIGFDQAVNFELAAHLVGGGSPINQIATGGSGGGGIPVSVTGTVESPQVHPNIGKMVKNVGEELLGSFFKKKPK